MNWLRVFFVFCFFTLQLEAKIRLGIDCFFQEGHHLALKGKKVGVITNHTGVNAKLQLTSDLLLDSQDSLEIKAFFSPEHGFSGSGYAFEKIISSKLKGIPVYSLFGETRRPTEKMLGGLDVLIYDIQDIGVRAYTYATTLFYCMEEAAKKKIEVIVLDRPNPMGGHLVDGPMLAENWRSFIGYVNVPYCHGMTIGELAHLFNEEYQLGCKLKVIPMKGWKREMEYKDTGLNWIPPSPHIPESDTPLFCATTGILGEIDLVNIGVGYTLPFKVVGAQWIDADLFAKTLNQQKLPGVHFSAFHYKPFYGSYKGVECHGVLIVIDNPLVYKPVKVQCALIGILKSLYPKKFKESFSAISKKKKRLFCLATGGNDIWNILESEKFATWKLIEVDKEQRERFLKKRKKYLRPEYSPN